MPSRSKELSTTRPSQISVPAPLTAAAEHELRVCVTRLDPPIEAGKTGYEIAADAAPSPAMRQALEFRKARLDDCFRPAGHGLVAAELDRMIDAGMQIRADEPGAMVRWAAGAADDLADLPAFALVAACQDLRRGVIGDGRWLPEVGVIRSTAHLKVHALAKERREIEAVLSARVRDVLPDPGRKARLIAEARNLGAAMSMKDAIDRAARAGREVDPDAIPDLKLSPEDRRARYAAHAESLKGQPLPPLSPYLRSKLGLPGHDMVPDGIGSTEDAA